MPLSYSVCIAKHLFLVRQTIVAEHEIRNISCAAQDPDDLCTFAYITKDLKSGHHFCHVFSTVEVVSEIYLFSPKIDMACIKIGKTCFHFF